MRLIDADALSKKICEDYLQYKDFEQILKIIDRTPTVEAIVNCKDCRHKYWDIEKNCRCPFMRGQISVGFCHHAKRREPCD